MARYFFDTIDGGRVVDDEGAELINDAAARVHAIKYAGGVLSNEPDVLRDGSELRVYVENADRVRLFTVVCYSIEGSDGRRH